MKRGVLSGTWGFGGLFHGGIGGKFAVDCAKAASGKLSITRGDGLCSGLYVSWSGITCFAGPGAVAALGGGEGGAASASGCLISGTSALLGTGSVGTLISSGTWPKLGEKLVRREYVVKMVRKTKTARASKVCVRPLPIAIRRVLPKLPQITREEEDDSAPHCQRTSRCGGSKRAVGLR